MKNKKTLYHFVLDKSGSMGNCRETTVNGFNSQLETIKEFPEHELIIFYCAKGERGEVKRIKLDRELVDGLGN
jgi:predicted metal-dependent peptidase